MAHGHGRNSHGDGVIIAAVVVVVVLMLVRLVSALLGLRRPS